MANFLLARRDLPERGASLFLDRVMRIAHSFRLAIGCHRGEDTTGLCPIGHADLDRAADRTTDGEKS